MLPISCFAKEEVRCGGSLRAVREVQRERKEQRMGRKAGDGSKRAKVFVNGEVHFKY